MAEQIEELLESMVPALHELEEKKIFSAKEIKKIVKKRRDFEYKLRSCNFLLMLFDIIFFAI